MTGADAANMASNVEALTALPYDLDAIREVFEANNAAKRTARESEVKELNAVMAHAAQRQHDLDQANERALSTVLRRLAVTEELLKAEREVRAKLQATIDTFTATVAKAVGPLDRGVEEVAAEAHTLSEKERLFREQYEPPRQPDPTDGDDGGGQTAPLPKPERSADEIVADQVDRELAEALTQPLPDPVMPLAPAAVTVERIDDPLEIPIFLRRNKADAARQAEAVAGHVDELFEPEPGAIATAMHKVGAALEPAVRFIRKAA